MQIHSPGFCCNPGRRDRPINTEQRRGDPGLSAGDHKFTNPSMPLTLRMVGPRSRELQNPPSTQMADLPEGWGCGWQQRWCKEGTKEEVEVRRMNREKAGGEFSVGQLKVLMVILREQNYSHRWLRSLYLVGKNEGNRTRL